MSDINHKVHGVNLELLLFADEHALSFNDAKRLLHTVKMYMSSSNEYGAFYPNGAYELMLDTGLVRWDDSLTMLIANEKFYDFFSRCLKKKIN